jgi:hypothetical protein
MASTFFCCGVSRSRAASAPATSLSGAFGKVGVTAKSSRPSATENVVHAPPRARALRGKRENFGEWRKGFSTQ